MPLHVEPKTPLGAKVRELRSERGWSQEELAHRASSTLNTISQIERGVREPQLDTLRKLASAFEVEFVDLFAHKS